MRVVMDFKQSKYRAVYGTIVDIISAAGGNHKAEECILYAMVEDSDGNTVNFMITPATYVVDFETLKAGMQCTFWYDTDLPAVLIYPPQYQAAVVALHRNGRMVQVDYFDADLVSRDRMLQLLLDPSVAVRTTNNQEYRGTPGDQELVVIYESATRSLPAQTTPREIVVLCPLFL